LHFLSFKRGGATITNTVQKTYPIFNIELLTNETSYELVYNTANQLTSDNFEQALISFTTRNAMEDDSPVFSIVLAGKEKWDKILTVNDLVRIEIIEDLFGKGINNNTFIMVGLISDIHKEGEFANGSIVYRIMGRGMPKVLMDFNIGVIQEIAVLIPSVGWLPDQTKNGLNFSGNTASGIAGEVMDRFIFNDKWGAKYTFITSNGKKSQLADYFTYQFTSWTQDESLVDVTPFVNYQGSIRQFLEDVAAKPFNELYFEFSNDGKCVAFMRPTPFDADKWYDLPVKEITSEEVVQESFGKNDAEMYSIFVVQAPNIMEFNSLDIGVYPKFHPALVDKYGYKRLDANNRYLISSGSNAAITGSGTGNGTTDGGIADGTNPLLPPWNALWAFVTKNKLTEKENLTGKEQSVGVLFNKAFPNMSNDLIIGIIAALEDGTLTYQTYSQLIFFSGQNAPTVPTYEVLMVFLRANKFDDPETVRKSRNKVYAALSTEYRFLAKNVINGILDSLKAGKFTDQVYEELLANAGTSANNSGSPTIKQAAGDLLDKYTQRLFNWYCENVNFYAGDIRVVGSPDYRIGSRLFYTDSEEPAFWEFYIESVQHEFDFTGGYTTILGVTRGLQNDEGDKRFSNLYDKSQDFTGGYLGELSLNQLFQQGAAAQATNGTGLTPTSTGGGGIGGGGLIQVTYDPYGNPVAGSTSGGPTAMMALSTASKMTSRAAVYSFGAGRGHNPFYDTVIYADCSSFVYWCYKTNGVTLNGSTTDSIKQDPRLISIGVRGGNKNQVLSLMQLGDLIWFDTYKVDGHIGIYSGNGKFIAISGPKGYQQDIKENDLTSSYYWNVFKGHVMRFNG
jgi:cell wall-associated NlpC family hydrolase